MGYHYCQIAGFSNHDNVQSSDADLQVWFESLLHGTFNWTIGIMAMVRLVSLLGGGQPKTL